MDSSKFIAFPPEIIQFYRDLEANNNRDWFMAHKRDYVDYVQTPAIAFIGTMGARLKEITPNIIADLRTNGAGSLMRIYRDIRFSKHVALLTHLQVNCGTRLANRVS